VLLSWRSNESACKSTVVRVSNERRDRKEGHGGCSTTPGAGQVLDASFYVPDISSLQSGPVYEEISVDIPRMIMKKLASSEIGPGDIDKYAKPAGPRKRM
jgi:hypothetical protein